MTKRPQRCLTKCLKPKKPTLLLEKQSHHQKPMLFIKKQSWMTKKKLRAPWKINYGPLQIPMNKRPQHYLTKCFEPKKPTLSLEKTISASKTNSFHCKKRSWMTKKLRAPWKINWVPSKIKESFVDAMTCCKNVKLSFETNSAFEKVYKFQ